MLKRDLLKILKFEGHSEKIINVFKKIKREKGLCGLFSMVFNALSGKSYQALDCLRNRKEFTLFKPRSNELNAKRKITTVSGRN